MNIILLVVKCGFLFNALYFSIPILGALFVYERGVSAKQNAVASFSWAMFYFMTQLEI